MKTIETERQHQESPSKVGTGEARAVEIGSRQIVFKRGVTATGNSAASWQSDEGYHVIEHKDGQCVPDPFDRILVSNFDDAARIASAALDFQRRHHQEKTNYARMAKQARRKLPVAFAVAASMGLAVGWFAHSWAY
jgi:hypothetical protein